MKTSILLLALTLTACGPNLDGASYVETTCMEQFYTKAKINPDRLQYNINLARDTFVWMGLSKSNKAFCDEFKNQVVVIEDLDHWYSMGGHMGQDIEGNYDLYRGIKLSRWGKDLLHELFHAVDVGRHQALSSAWHGGWDTNGYYMLSDWYFGQTPNITQP
jgi:hypothetical protein